MFQGDEADEKRELQITITETVRQLHRQQNSPEVALLVVSENT